MKILITGATGFLGKIVVEEILRQQIPFEKIYLLVRPKKSKSGEQRIKDVLSSPCFISIPEERKQGIEALQGDVAQKNLGISSQDREKLTGELTHIINCAASVHFNKPLPEIAKDNIQSVLDMANLAQDCPHLQVLSHVSTAYVNHPSASREDTCPEALVPLKEPANKIHQDILNHREFDDFASGYPNTYTFTKCVAEHLLVAKTQHSPFQVNILRPSIIANSWRYPYPGWTDSFTAYMGYSFLLGSGLIKGVAADNSKKLNIIPVDYTAQAIIHKTLQDPGENKLAIYHITASPEDQPTIAKIKEYIVKYYRSYPFARYPYLIYSKKGMHYKFIHLFIEKLPLLIQRKYHQIKGEEGKARYFEKVLQNITSVHDTFYYFCHHTWNFESSLEYAPEMLENYYQETVLQGCLEYLAKKDLRKFTVAGHKHKPIEKDLQWLFKKNQANFTVRFIGYVLRKILRRSFNQVTVDIRSFPKQPPNHSYIIVPNYQSYFDYLLVCYVLFDRAELQIKHPFVAGSSELFQIPLINLLLRNARYVPLASDKRNHFHNAWNRVLSDKENLQFFVDSENEKEPNLALFPPQEEIWKYIRESGQTFTILPIKLDYEKIPEAEAKQAKPQSHPIGTGSFVSWTWRSLRGKLKLGDVHIKAGRPITFQPGSDPEKIIAEVVEELQHGSPSKKCSAM